MWWGALHYPHRGPTTTEGPLVGWWGTVGYSGLEWAPSGLSCMPKMVLLFMGDRASHRLLSFYCSRREDKQVGDVINLTSAPSHALSHPRLPFLSLSLSLSLSFIFHSSILHSCPLPSCLIASVVSHQCTLFFFPSL